jgi:glutamine synthetase adenylyltransferase
VGIAVFALGSYAVDEPRMSSDLDLVVVTDGADVPAVTTAVQLINRWFTDGNVLKLDFRLRGEGASAPLVQEVSFYRDYFARRVSLWERVALSKCRAWWGDERTQAAFLEALRTVVAAPFTPDQVAQLASVRTRVEGLAPKRFPVWETKRSAGARYDIEYLTAIGLASSDADDDFFALTTRERLQRLADEGILEPAERDACLSALDTFGLVEYLMELQSLSHPTSKARHETLGRYLDRCCRFLDVPAPDGVGSLLDGTRANVRRVYERVIAAAQED